MPTREGGDEEAGAQALGVELRGGAIEVSKSRNGRKEMRQGHGPMRAL